MSVPGELLRRIDYYDYYSSKIEAARRYIHKHARKGHGHMPFKGQPHRTYRNGPRPRGMHDYQNLQWDPSIYRGRTFRDFREKNLPPTDTIVNVNKFCCVGCNNSNSNNSTKAFPAIRRRSEVGLPRQKVGGVFRPTTDDIVFEESSGRKRHKQDESRKEMEPFIIEQLVPPTYAESGAQGDETKDRPKQKCHPVAVGTSSSAQADICIIGTGNREDPLEPILENMGSKVLEQSLLETFEEYELYEIRCEIRRYMEKRRTRHAREVKLVECQLFKAMQMEQEKVRREKELDKELEANEMVAAAQFSINACNIVIAHALENLREHRFLAGEDHDAEIFKPWAHQQMYRHLQVPRMIVSDIIHNVGNNRLVEYNVSTLMTTVEDTSPTVHQEEDVDNLDNQTRPQSGNDEEEEDDYSSLGPPPNTASSLPYSTTDDEGGDSTAEERSLRFNVAT